MANTTEAPPCHPLLPDRPPGADRELHGRGLGSQVLASALTRAAVAARGVGGRLVVADAIDEAAAAFYRHQGSTPISADAHRLALPIKAIDDSRS